jgi:hypothetical protein
MTFKILKMCSISSKIGEGGGGEVFDNGKMLFQQYG